jgi:alcohol dehydrogenase (cytochrome c)
MRIVRHIIVPLSLLLLFGVAVLSLGLWWYSDSPALAWRLSLIRLKTLGALPQESWTDIARRISPGNLFQSEGPKHFREIVIANPLTSDQHVEAGMDLFQAQCVICHSEGGNAAGPDLRRADFQTRATDSDIYLAIAHGVEGTAMTPYAGPPVEVLQLTSYVRSLAADSATVTQPERAQSDCVRCEAINVGFERLANAAKDTSNWLTYSGALNGQRFATLDQIDRNNVSRLRANWIYQMRSLDGVQSVPLVVDGVMFLTGPQNEVIALDADTGKPYWTFERAVPGDVPLCCGKRNRGVAILGNRVYHATLDAHLIALDIRTGKPVWDVELIDYHDGYSMTAAPLAVNGKIIVGVAGSEYPIRGFIDAYDAETGKRAWRFYTIPGPGEPGHETWENDAWKTGGGGTWVTGSYDPELNLVYWGIGNPAPAHDASYRPGDNLYTCSVVAIDPDTGQLKWHYQFTPSDTHDWDAAIVPVLADLEYEGRPRKTMLWANRNCFFYILDRETGEFLKATEYCKQTWNDGFTKEGRPIKRPNSDPSDEGAIIFPSVGGGSTWFAPAFSPLTGLYYVAYRDWGQKYYRKTADPEPARFFAGGFANTLPGMGDKGAYQAIRGTTGEVAWTVPLGRSSRSGLLVTATGLLFGGTREGELLALDAATGEELWRTQIGGEISMGPITYMHNGAQHLAIISNGVLFNMNIPN